jgi:hypothetical protein
MQQFLWGWFFGIGMGLFGYKFLLDWMEQQEQLLYGPFSQEQARHYRDRVHREADEIVRQASKK